jgi:pyruvate ferredoxin oxidoreductase gamma subunit
LKKATTAFFNIRYSRVVTKGFSMIEIRFHGRGGQGAVTSAELLAQAAIAEGQYAQAFPSFGPERRGAPVLAFARIDSQPIRLRQAIYEPQIALVLEEALMNIVNVEAGMGPDGIVLVNTAKNAADLRQRYQLKCRIWRVDATKIALEGLGRPITNTTMLGALVKACGCVKLASMEEPLLERFGKLGPKNLAVLKRAFDEASSEETA